MWGGYFLSLSMYLAISLANNVGFVFSLFIRTSAFPCVSYFSSTRSNILHVNSNDDFGPMIPSVNERDSRAIYRGNLLTI